MSDVAPAEVDALQALLLLRLGDVRRLPDIATTYLTLGLDSEALRELAGLDLDKPVDPYDARDLFWQSVDELGLPRLAQERAGEHVGYLYARLTTEHRIGLRRATELFFHLAVRLDYRAEPAEIMELYGLDDMWNLGVTDDATIERDVIDTARRVVVRHEGRHPALSHDALDRLSPILVP